MKKSVKGKHAENIACKFLKRNRYRILERNFRCKIGEIDIIAQRNSEIVIVEVKSSASESSFSPLESITSSKIDRLYRLAEFWLYRNTRRDTALRFDAVGVVFKKRKSIVTHIEDAF